MTPLLYLIGIMCLVRYIFRGRVNPANVYILLWLVIFLNYYLGPILYIPRTQNALSLIFLIAYLSLFLGAFWLGNNFNPKASVQNRSLKVNVNPPKWLSNLEKIGALGVTLYFFGRLITGANFLISGDLSGLRASFIEDTNLLSQIGSVLIGLYFFSISRALFYGRAYRLSYMPLFMFILTPLLTAGRQLYLILILMILISTVLLSRVKGNIIKWFAENKAVTFPVVLASIAILLVVSILRFDATSQSYFGDKFLMIQHYSSIELRSDYFYLTSLPTVCYDTIIELFYYFGAQLARYYELFDNLNFDIYNFDLLSKTPVIQRNLDKIFSVFGYQSSPVNFKYPELSIASFTWSTAIIANLRYGGIVTALFLQFLFALILGFAYRRFRLNSGDYPAFNLVVVSSVISIYDIMFPLISDTSIMVYYFFSILIFLKKPKCLSRLKEY